MRFSSKHACRTLASDRQEQDANFCSATDSSHARSLERRRRKRTEKSGEEEESGEEKSEEEEEEEEVCSAQFAHEASRPRKERRRQEWSRERSPERSGTR